MAQGVSGYFDLVDQQYGITVRIHYAETYNVSTSTSDVAITNVQVMATASGRVGAQRFLSGSITINGITAVTMSSYYGGSSIYIDELNQFYDVEFDEETYNEVESLIFEPVTGILHNNDGSMSVDISASISFVRQSGSDDWAVSGSKTVALTTIIGYIYIDNGSGFERYQVYIDNGTSWDLYMPYIDNGTSWDLYG